MAAIEHRIGDYLLEKLACRIEAEAGLTFSGPRLRDLDNALLLISKSLGFEHQADCLHWLLSGPWSSLKTDVCGKFLTIGETYFFREARALELVCDYAEKKFARNRGSKSKLRIWSAGCCSGEEPYSIAIALADRFPAIGAAQLSIIGTDINPDRLAMAKRGIYRQWAMRSIDQSVLQRYFKREMTGEYHISGSIKSLVEFRPLNLAGSGYPSADNGTEQVDIIFCRNVLMYFSKQQARHVIERMRRCLVDGGWLIVSPSEASPDLYAGFRAVFSPDAIHFQKCETTCDGGEAVSQPPRTTPEGARSSGALLDEPVSAFLSTKRRKSYPSALVPNSGKAPAVHDKSPKIDYQRTALMAMEAGDMPGALHALKAEIYLRPESILAYYWLGVVLAGEQQYQSAMRNFGTANKLLSGLPDEAFVPGSEHFTAAYLRETVARSMKKAEEALGHATQS